MHVYVCWSCWECTDHIETEGTGWGLSIWDPMRRQMVLWLNAMAMVAQDGLCTS